MKFAFATAAVAALATAQADLNGKCLECILENYNYCAESPFATNNPVEGRCIALETACTANLAAGATDTKLVNSFAGCDRANVESTYATVAAGLPAACPNLLIDESRFAKSAEEGEDFNMWDYADSVVVPTVTLAAGTACRFAVSNTTTKQGSVGFTQAQGGDIDIVLVNVPATADVAKLGSVAWSEVNTTRESKNTHEVE